MSELRAKITGIIGKSLIDAGTKIPSEIADKILALFPQWISVEDRLPEGKVEALTLSICDNMEVGFYSNKYNVWSAQDGVKVIGFVTHWQPLPQPPKEGK